MEISFTKNSFFLFFLDFLSKDRISCPDTVNVVKGVGAFGVALGSLLIGAACASSFGTACLAAAGVAGLGNAATQLPGEVRVIFLLFYGPTHVKC